MIDEIVLKSPFSDLWKNKDPFVEVEQLSGEVYRAVKQRKTFNFHIDEKSYFIKIHHGETLKEIFKNLVSCRLPVLDAKQEWNAIHHLQSHNVDTMNGRAFGRKGLNPLTRHSFIITEDLNPAISLEDVTNEWLTASPDVMYKRRLIEQLAITTTKMHQAGVNHRDCYLCHFLLDETLFNQENKIKLSIIDLHRAQIRKKVPLRWRDKDLIGLYFSSSNIGLTSRDVFRFMKTYFAKPLRTILKEEQTLMTIAEKKSARIRRRTNKYNL